MTHHRYILPSLFRPRLQCLHALCLVLCPWLQSIAAMGQELSSMSDSIHTGHNLNYILTAEGAVGTGDYTAYYLTANRHGILGTDSNTGYLRAAMQYNYRRGKWNIESGLDVEAQAHAYNKFFVQQLYAQATWSWITLGLGTREFLPVLRDSHLSSGSTIWSGNSRPIPQVYLQTPGFVNVPGTKGRLQFYLDASYGKLMDDHYKEDCYDRYSRGKDLIAASFLTTDVWFHQKKLHLRTDPTQHLYFTMGFDHAAYFGGTSRNENYDGRTSSYDIRFKDFFKVLLPTSGEDNSPVGDQVFFYGSHLGEESFRLDYQWGGEDKRERRVGIYFENLFEDGSSIAKFNGWDGLWGIEYHNRQKDAWIQGAVIEYLQTTNQSGPMHWDPEDYKAAYGDSFDVGRAMGADDYYNNFFYAGHTYYGLGLGSPMVKSPVYNADGYLRFTDNRILAWHAGIEGALVRGSRLSRLPGNLTFGYRVLTSYRRSWGSAFVPSSSIRDAFCAMFELNAHYRSWAGEVAYAFDHGDLLGNNQSFNFSITYHGKVF